jgi:hypothetical protein
VPLKAKEATVCTASCCGDAAATQIEILGKPEARRGTYNIWLLKGSAVCNLYLILKR